MNTSLNEAAKGAKVGIGVYLLLAVTKLVGAYFLNSLSLQADGLNNLTDIISSVVIFVGLHLAKQPADNDHHYGHSKFEAIASFMTAMMMFLIGWSVIKEGVDRFMHRQFTIPDVTAVWIAILSGIVLLVAYRYVRFLAQKAQSLALKASAKDMLNDLLISAGTGIAIISAIFGIVQMDLVMSVIVGILILKTAYEIFRESTFALSDGFDKEELEKYRHLIAKHPKILGVPSIKGRLCGSQVYVDVTIEVDGEISVTHSHYITQDIERMLSYNYGVREVDVHVEPYYENE